MVQATYGILAFKWVLLHFSKLLCHPLSQISFNIQHDFFRSVNLRVTFSEICVWFFISEWFRYTVSFTYIKIKS